MALKAELINWNKSLQKFDSGDFEECLNLLRELQDRAIQYYNTAIVQTILNSNYLAIDSINRAIKKDPWFAAAYFQRGFLLFQEGDFEKALEDYQDCYQVLLI
jgi:tetratricopeptide (TPR) repeat protein